MDAEARMSLQTTKVEMDVVQTGAAKQTEPGRSGWREAARSRSLPLSGRPLLFFFFRATFYMEISV